MLVSINNLSDPDNKKSEALYNSQSGRHRRRMCDACRLAVVAAAAVSIVVHQVA
jgi:hypothetical protein